MAEFNYYAAAEVYTSLGNGNRQKEVVTYRRFDRSVDAIRYTVEVLAPQMQQTTSMEVGEQRFAFAQIRALYDSEQYPLSRPGEA